ncbi:MAG: four helix bundle suffix domain-containing protein [Candidatus Gottesmanbacteria bacterium]|nr:four helix bundle suffix domain-containing protein [Candidatus Gottesmanbacteria bacterium]
MSLPKHKYLLTYRYSEIIFDLTMDFCKSFVAGYGQKRTREQMEQAARSGKQNIIEGIGQSATSKRGEMKLLGVAKASQEELLADYEDFLRNRNLPIWPKTDGKVSKLRHYAFRISALSNVSDLGYLKEKPKLPENPEIAANLLLTLCHQVTYLLSKQIQKAEDDFVKNGGFTEKLFQKRLQSKMHS